MTAGGATRIGGCRTLRNLFIIGQVKQVRLFGIRNNARNDNCEVVWRFAFRELLAFFEESNDIGVGDMRTPPLGHVTFSPSFVPPPLALCVQCQLELLID